MGFSNMIFDVYLSAANKSRDKGRFDKAAKDFDRAVKEARQPGAPLQAVTLSLLMRGVNYRDWANTGFRDKFVLAEQDYLELLRIYEAARGPQGEDALRTRRLLGVLCKDWGAISPAKLVDAERWMREWLGAVPDTNAEKAEVLFTLGQVLAAQGRRPEAAQPLVDALAITDATAGPESLGSAVLHSELGNFYWAEKRYDLAVSHLQVAIQLKEKLNGVDHPSLEPTLAALAAVYQDIGQQVKADAAMQKAIAIGRMHGVQKRST